MTLLGYDDRRAPLRGGHRAMDIALVLAGLPAFGPVVLAVALAIRVDDGGPSFYWQRRLGRGRLPFWVLKLRTMRRGQVTRIGRWLRPTGLDEVPQLINVLLGDMDLVGPRPLTEADATRLAAADPSFAERYRVRPGITGAAQVFGGTSTQHCFQLERGYARRRTVWSDLGLLAASVAINIVGRARVRALLSESE